MMSAEGYCTRRMVIGESRPQGDGSEKRIPECQKVHPCEKSCLLVCLCVLERQIKTPRTHRDLDACV